MTLPIEDRYAVDRQTGVVHRPYVDHAAAFPRTTPRGVYTYTATPTACGLCWPSTPPPEPADLGYYCLRCDRRHVEGSAIHDAHLAPEDPDPPTTEEAPEYGDTAEPEGS